MGKVTIKEIAQKLGISAQSVSCALNDKDNVSEGLKERVKKLAIEMGYEKNHIATSLKTKKTKSIGLFIFRRSIEIRQRVLNGIISKGREFGYDIVLFTMGSEYDRKKSYAKLCKQRMVDGVIFTGIRLDDPHIEEIKELDIPVVIMDADLGGELNSVSMDHRVAVKSLVKHLKELGHERISLVNGHDLAQISEEVERYYRLEVDRKWQRVEYCDFNLETAYEATEKIIKSQLLPTAIIAINNTAAMGVMSCLEDNGLRVPDDISLVQLNDVTISKYLNPPLTSIYQNDFLRGEKAMELVITNQKSQIIKVEPLLNIRSSSVKVKK